MVFPAPELLGADREETVRSGPILIERLLVLLVWLVSYKRSSASALAMMYQVPSPVSDGMVTAVEAELTPRGARAGTARLAKGVSVSSQLELLDR